MASANAHKALEIAQILTDHEIEPRPDSLGEIVEDQETLEGNARLKALAVCAEVKSPAVADDTGLEVDALLADLQELQQAHHLEAARVRQQVARPAHEAVQPPRLVQHLRVHELFFSRVSSQYIPGLPGNENGACFLFLHAMQHI